MSHPPANLLELVEEAKPLGPIRIAVVNAAQRLVLEAVREAQSLGPHRAAPDPCLSG